MKAQIEICFEDGTMFTAFDVDMEPAQLVIREDPTGRVDLAHHLGPGDNLTRSFLSLDEVELQPDEHGICYHIVEGHQ